MRAAVVSLIALLSSIENCASSHRAHPASVGSAEDMREAAFVEEPPKRLVDFPPEYPPDLRADGIEGRVTFRVVLDTAGVPELSTFRIVSSPSVELSDAVRVAVARWRYAPARVNGRAVRVMIEQWIDFHARNRARDRPARRGLSALRYTARIIVPLASRVSVQSQPDNSTRRRWLDGD